MLAELISRADEADEADKADKAGGRSLDDTFFPTTPKGILSTEMTYGQQQEESTSAISQVSSSMPTAAWPGLLAFSRAMTRGKTASFSQSYVQ